MTKLGKRTVERDARTMRVLLGASPAPVGAVDHGGLLGLTDDDHSQYVHLSAARTLTAQHAFSPASAQPPFTLGANAQGQLVTGLRADELNKTVTAGAGLTGGGTLTGGITLTVGAGDGITVNANDVALTTPGSVTVSSSNSASGNHTHAVVASSNPGAAANLLKTDASGDLTLQNLTLAGTTGLILNGVGADLTFSGSGDHDLTASSGTLRLGALTLTGAVTGNSQTLTGLAQLTVDNLRLDGNTLDSTSGNLNLDAAGDVVLNPTGNDVIPSVAYDLNLGSPTKKFLTLHAAELWVQTLVAQETLATIGGRILVAPSNELIADVTTGATSISVKYNNLFTGDRIYLEAAGAVEWMAIAGVPADITDGYAYTVTRNLDGTGANAWSAGDSLVNTGQAGSGFIDLYSLQSIHARALDYVYVDDGGVFSANYADSAYFALYPATGVVNDALYLGRTDVGWSGKSAYFYLGTAASVSATFVYEYWNGAAWTSFTPTTSPSFNSTGQHDWGMGTLASEATTAVNGETAYWVRRRVSGVLSWTTSPIQAGRRVTLGAAQWGPTIVGWVRNSSTFNDLSEAWAIGNLNNLYGYGADTYGVGLGKYGTTAENYLTVDATDGLRFFTGATVTGQLTGSTWTLGSVSGGEYVKITSSAVELYGNAVKTVDIRSNGDVYLGNSGGERLFYDESAGTLEFLNAAGTAMITIDGANEYVEVGLPKAVRLDDGGVYVDSDNGKFMIGPVFGATGDYGEITGGLSSTGQHNGTYQVPAKAGLDSGYSNTLNVIAGGHTGANTSENVTFRLYSQADGTEYWDWLLGTSSLMRLGNNGTLYLGETANANMSVGLTINQGASDDEILAFKSSDVAHGMTDLAETDSWGVQKKHAGATGGLRLQGFTEDNVGLALYGHYTNDDTARATTANGAVIIRGSKKSGTTEGAPGANANLLVVKSASNARFIVDQEGDIHMDATSNINAWDEHNDIELLAGVREAMGVRLAEFVESARPVLERTGVVKYNPDGHHFISLKSLHALEIDAMRQLYQRILRVEKVLGLSKGGV